MRITKKKTSNIKKKRRTSDPHIRTENNSVFHHQLNNYQERLRLYKSKLDREKSKLINKNPLPLLPHRMPINVSYRKKPFIVEMESQLRQKNQQIMKLKKKLN